MSDYYANNAAQAQNAYPYPPSTLGAAAPPPGLLEKINRIGDPLAEAVKSLIEIENRLFGPRPQEVSKGDPPMYGNLSGALDLTEQGAVAIAESCRRILARL